MNQASFNAFSIFTIPNKIGNKAFLNQRFEIIKELSTKYLKPKFSNLQENSITNRLGPQQFISQISPNPVRDDEFCVALIGIQMVKKLKGECAAKMLTNS